MCCGSAPGGRTGRPPRPRSRRAPSPTSPASPFRPSRFPVFAAALVLRTAGDRPYMCAALPDAPARALPALPDGPSAVAEAPDLHVRRLRHDPGAVHAGHADAAGGRHGDGAARRPGRPVADGPRRPSQMRSAAGEFTARRPHAGPLAVDMVFGWLTDVMISGLLSTALADAGAAQLEAGSRVRLPRSRGTASTSSPSCLRTTCSASQRRRRAHGDGQDPRFGEASRSRRARCSSTSSTRRPVRDGAGCARLLDDAYLIHASSRAPHRVPAHVPRYQLPHRARTRARPPRVPASHGDLPSPRSPPHRPPRRPPRVHALPPPPAARWRPSAAPASSSCCGRPAGGAAR